jgi:prepilin-type N-terminal cleavage/methylation domain-containing protein
MGITMSSRRRVLGSRTGVSLIEVIACTAIVGVMIVPIAGVIRASG